MCCAYIQSSLLFPPRLTAQMTHDSFRNVIGARTRNIFMTFLMLLAVQAHAQQRGAYRAPRLPGTQLPNLNGVWQAVNSANWNIEPHAAAPSPFPALLGAIGAEPAGLGVVEGGKIPYQAWAEAKRKENFEKRLARP